MSQGSEPAPGGAAPGTGPAAEGAPGERWHEAGWSSGSVTWTTWTWSPRGAGFSWVGAFLVLLGAALILHEVEPRLGTGALVTLALGLLFAGAYLLRRWTLAIWPTTVLIALGLQKLLAGLGYVDARGWDAVALGLGILAAWLVERVAGVRHGWALGLAAIFLVLGALQLSGEGSVRAVEGYAGPVILVGVGILLVASSLLDRRPAR